MSPLVEAFDDTPEFGEISPVAEGVWWLKMPLPFELDHINLYLIEEADSWVIIDTGLGGKQSRDIWQKLFAGPLAEKPLRQVICTHYHPDHVGSAGWLCEHYNVPLLISKKEYDCTQLQFALADDAERQYRYLEELGVEHDDATPIVKSAAMLLHMYDPLPEQYQPLEDGQTLLLGEHTWRVQLADGHSPAHATLFCEALGVLISGDQVLPRISSNVSVRIDEPEANPLRCWLRGLNALYQLPEETLVLPAHDSPFYGLHRRLKALEKAHDDLLARLLDALTDKPQTVLELAHQMYSRKLHNFTLMLALGECQSHLHYLVDEGRITRARDKQGRLCYQLNAE